MHAVKYKFLVDNACIPFTDFGIRVGLGCSNIAEVAVIESALWGGFFTGSATGGVVIFWAFGFSHVSGFCQLHNQKLSL